MSCGFHEADGDGALSAEQMPASIPPASARGAEPEAPAQIASDDSVDLFRLEQIICNKFEAFFGVGAALSEIKDRKLYLPEFATFEEYCQKRWNMTRNHVHSLLSAAQAYLKLFPSGHNSTE